jgi:hypothetical protein
VDGAGLEVLHRVLIGLVVPVVEGEGDVDRAGGGRLGQEDALRQCLGDVLRAQRLVAPLHQRIGQRGRVDVGQHRVQRRIAPGLLAGGHDDRHVTGLGVRQVTLPIALPVPAAAWTLPNDGCPVAIA